MTFLKRSSESTKSPRDASNVPATPQPQRPLPPSSLYSSPGQPGGKRRARRLSSLPHSTRNARASIPPRGSRSTTSGPKGAPYTQAIRLCERRIRRTSGSGATKSENGHRGFITARGSSLPESASSRSPGRWRQRGPARSEVVWSRRCTSWNGEFDCGAGRVVPVDFRNRFLPVASSRSCRCRAGHEDRQFHLRLWFRPKAENRGASASEDNAEKISVADDPVLLKIWD